MKLTQIDSPEDLLKDHDKNNIAVEEKLDGFKIQAIKDGKVKVYSRNGIDKTANVPDIVEALNFLPDKTFIEGELVYVENGKQHLEKVTSLIGGGAEKSVTKQKEMPGQLKFYVYDVILFKGKKISDKPFSERRKVLESLIKKSKFVDITKQYSFDQWQEAMKIAKEKNEEGIVLKLKDKPYLYKSLGQNEPKPKYMFKFKGGIGKSDSDDYVIYDYKLGKKGKLKALFGQYYKGKLYGISEISNFSKENEEIIKNKLKKGPFVIEIGFGERVPGGLRHQRFNRYREDKSTKDCTMNKYHAQYIDNFEVISQKNDDGQFKIAAVSDDIIKALRNKIEPSIKEMPAIQKQISGVDTEKAFEIISTLESNGNYIIGDSGTSFGKTQVQLGGFLSYLLREPNIKEISGLDKQEIKELKTSWESAKTKFRGVNFWKTVPVDAEKIRREIKIKPNAVVKRREGVTIRINPDSNPGVVKIKNKQFVGYELDLDKLQSLGLDVNSYKNSLQKLMDNYITDNVVYSGISKIYVAQQAPAIYNKFVKIFSKSNVDKDQRLKNLTDNISKTDLMDRINQVVEMVNKYGYNTNAPGSYNIYQLIAISNASGVGAVQNFLKNKKPFYPGQLTYLQRANKLISSKTGLASNFPENDGLNGFKFASQDQNILKTAKYIEPGTMYFPSQYAEDIKRGKRKFTIRPFDNEIKEGEIVKCISYGEEPICDLLITSKQNVDLDKIEEKLGKRFTKALERKFGDIDFTLIEFDVFKNIELFADDEDKEKMSEILIDKDGIKLTRGQIKKHYYRPEIRKRIMSRIKDKPILVYLGISKNEKILKRNHNEKQIVITNDDINKKDDPNNYFYWVDRRLLSIHEVFGKKTKLGFVDLDLHGEFSFNDAKKYAEKLSSILRKQFNSVKVYQSGGQGIHVEFSLSKETDIDKLREELKNILNELNKDYKNITVSTVKGTGMRSDVSTLHNKGSLRVPWAFGETYGKIKKPISSQSGDDDFGIKYTDLNENLDVDPKSLETGAISPKSSYGSLKKHNFFKLSKRSGVKEEYVWLWDDGMRRGGREHDGKLLSMKIIDNEKELGGDHIALVSKYGLDKIDDNNPRGFITFYNDGNIELSYYDNELFYFGSEIYNKVEDRFDLIPGKYKLIKISVPTGYWVSQYAEDIGQEHLNKILDILNSNEFNILISSFSNELENRGLEYTTKILSLNPEELKKIILNKDEVTKAFEAAQESFLQELIGKNKDLLSFPFGNVYSKLAEKLDIKVKDIAISIQQDNKEFEKMSGEPISNAKDFIDQPENINNIDLNIASPSFADKAQPPADKGGNTLDKWPDDSSFSELNFEVKNGKDLRKLFQDPQMWMDLKEKPELINIILPKVINVIGKVWFKNNSRYHKKDEIISFSNLPNAPFSMLDDIINSDMIKSIEEGKINISDLPESKIFIKQINETIAKLFNVYLSQDNIQIPIDKYLYKGIDNEMLKLIAEKREYKKQEKPICSICRSEKDIKTAIEPLIKVSPGIYKCPECEQKAKIIELQINNINKNIQKLNNKLESYNKAIVEINTEDLTERLKEKYQEEINKTGPLKDSYLKEIEFLNLQLVDATEKLNLRKAQERIPFRHTICPNPECKLRYIPLNCIDWSDQIWNTEDGKDLLNKVQTVLEINPPQELVKEQMAEDRPIPSHIEKSRIPSKKYDPWIYEIPFKCPSDGIKFKMKYVIGQGYSGYAGFFAYPRKKNVWSPKEEASIKAVEVEEIHEKPEETIETESMDKIYEFAVMEANKEYYKNYNRIRAMDIAKKEGKKELTLNDEVIKLENINREQLKREIMLQKTIADFSIDDPKAYLGWRIGIKSKDEFVKDEGVVEEKPKSFLLSLHERNRDVYLPVLQKWINNMLQYGDHFNLRDLFVDTGKKNEDGSFTEDGIPSDGPGTYFIAKIEGDKNNYGFYCKLESKRQKNNYYKMNFDKNGPRLIKILNVWDIKSISGITEDQLNGNDYIPKDIAEKILSGCDDVVSDVKSYDFHHVTLDLEAQIPIGNYVLVRAYLMPGRYDFKPLKTIKDIEARQINIWNKLNELITLTKDDDEFIETLKKEFKKVNPYQFNIEVMLDRNIFKAKQKKASFILSARDPLSKYKSKRDFDETAEPEGKVSKTNKHRFVIQKHDAKKLHFDLRLENDNGTLSSWAIPKHKLPSGNEKILCIKTEDHPLEYKNFEGEIESGYGKGTVEIYDSGTYEEIENKRDKIKFKLNGKKEKGIYNLIKTNNDQWLLIKSK